jgi:hypothetical protein
MSRIIEASDPRGNSSGSGWTIGLAERRTEGIFLFWEKVGFYSMKRGFYICRKKIKDEWKVVRPTWPGVLDSRGPLSVGRITNQLDAKLHTLTIIAGGTLVDASE